MANKAHRLSQEAATEAEGLLRAGRTDDARRLYLQAAQLEAGALSDIGSDQPRTHGILAVSAASLFFKAAEYRRAETLVHSYLVREDLPPFAQEQLRELLEVVWEKQALDAAGRQHTDETIMVSLRGSDIGAGRAPLGLVVDKILGIHSLLYRITELIGDFPFRTRGAPANVVRELCQPWVSEPQAGSYRFAVRLVEPIQLELIPTRVVRANLISEWFFRVMRTVSPAVSYQATLDTVEHLIPDTQYRHAILKLVRNMTPDGRRIREIEFTAHRDGGTETALLHAGARTRVADSLNADAPSGMSDEASGVLRAVHLDANWLEVVQQSGQPLHCRIEHEVLDDVVGPMINRQVIVRGRWTRRGTQFNLIDIELDASPDADVPPSH